MVIVSFIVYFFKILACLISMFDLQLQLKGYGQMAPGQPIRDVHIQENILIKYFSENENENERVSYEMTISSDIPL
jgi:hypothetical protein